jgi:CHAT domain-containing protein
MKIAISSYAPSFRVLGYALERSQAIPQAKLRGLLVSMERPDSHVAFWKNKMFLKSAQKERTGIEQITRGIEWTKLVRPSSQRVLQELPSYSVAHFITHGISDPKDPLKSHLVLMSTAGPSQAPHIEQTAADTTSEVVRDDLSIPKLFRCTAENAVLAFLAACSTADSQVPSLADENLHIVNAFQIAGFPHVVGTLWRASELVCPDFAKVFYSSLEYFTEEGTWTNDLIAFAHHCAVTTLVRDYRREPRLWACFVHMGA